MKGSEREKIYKTYFPPTSQKSYQYVKSAPGRPKGVAAGIYNKEYNTARKDAERMAKNMSFKNTTHRNEWIDATARDSAYVRSVEQQVSKDLHAISFMVKSKQGYISGGSEIRKSAQRALGYHSDVISAIKGAHPNYRISVNIGEQLAQVRKNVEHAKSQKTYKALGTPSAPPRFRPFTLGEVRDQKTTKRVAPEAREGESIKALGVRKSTQKPRVIHKPITRPSSSKYGATVPRTQQPKKRGGISTGSSFRIM